MENIRQRPFWIKKIREGLEKRSIVWLSGVRRVGKTTLCKMLDNILYLNCDLPSIQRQLNDPEFFYKTVDKNKIIIFDEIHRLTNPALILKIAADEYPELKILATGSSTLAATQKFKDALTGRKISITLLPVLWSETQTEFSINDFDKRLLHGGLPELMLSPAKEDGLYAEWIDSFYARDILELFSIRNRNGFMKLLHLLFRQSGSMIDYTQLAKLSDMSRPTVKSHIEALQIAHAIYLLSPFHGGGRREITQRPKCYGFDTGITTFVKGLNDIRDTDRGIFWEHLVLDMLLTTQIKENIFYWRDKSNHEIDFVIRKSNNSVDTIECKINPDKLDIKSLKEFRRLYPKGNNYCLTPFIDIPYKINKNDYSIIVINNTGFL